MWPNTAAIENGWAACTEWIGGLLGVYFRGRGSFRRQTGCISRSSGGHRLEIGSIVVKNTDDGVANAEVKDSFLTGAVSRVFWWRDLDGQAFVDTFVYEWQGPCGDVAQGTGNGRGGHAFVRDASARDRKNL